MPKLSENDEILGGVGAGHRAVVIVKPVDYAKIIIIDGDTGNGVPDATR
jgi:ribosomal protein L14E/L6E/L27E